MDNNFKGTFFNDDDAQAIILGQFDFMDLETEENKKMKRQLKGQESMFDGLNQTKTIENQNTHIDKNNNIDNKKRDKSLKDKTNIAQNDTSPHANVKIKNQYENELKNENKLKNIAKNHNFSKNMMQNDTVLEKDKPVNIQNEPQKNKAEEIRRVMKLQADANPPIDGLITKPLEEVMHDSMIPYTEHVVMDRALPRVEDGLKPVQRRILYTMYEDDLFPDKPYRKSATVVGDCLGRYHPHGDTSVYDAMVRMAQDFMLREPLVDGHGNFGSVDGDSAAAYRYTEAKLKPLALELLRDIDKNTVNWGLNFDDRRKEPDTLPGRFPNMLVNGAYGIAVGLATNIPPHNLAETIDAVCAYIDKPSINLNGIMKYIKGPDFPTGGILIVGDELEKAYATGKGKIIIRAKAFIEDNGDKKNIVITELPYQTNKAQLLQKIAELKEANKEKYSAIAEIRDETDRNGMRAVIRIKKEGNAKAILESLYKQTGLQVTFGINLVAIAGGKPKCMTLLEIISYYVEYQRQVIYRRTKFDLDACKDRAHILEGLLIAIKNIDEVIKIIKKSQNTNEAKQSLKSKFFLSEKQAQAILDMRLARLVNLEVNKIKEELAELKARIAELTEIYNSKAKQLAVVKSELLEIKKQYKSPRRSKIVGESEVETVEEVPDSELIADKDLYVAISQNNTIKAIPEKNYNLSGKEFSETSTLNDLYKEIVKVKSSDKVLLFTDKGNCLKIDVKNIPEAKYRERGIDFAKLDKNIEKDEKVLKIITLNRPQFELDTLELLFMTKQGMVKKSALNEYIIAKSYFQAIKLKDDEVIAVQEYHKDNSIIMVSKQGLVLNFENDTPTTGRVSGGVKGINLDDGDYCVFASQIKKQGALTCLTSKGFAKNVPVGEFEVSARYRKGLRVFNAKECGTIVAVSFGVVPPSFIIKHEGALYMLKSIYIPYDNRVGKGKQIYKEEDIRSAIPFLG